MSNPHQEEALPITEMLYEYYEFENAMCIDKNTINRICGIAEKAESMEEEQIAKVKALGKEEEKDRITSILIEMVKEMESKGIMGEEYLEKLQGIYKEYEGISVINEAIERINNH